MRRLLHPSICAVLVFAPPGLAAQIPLRKTVAVVSASGAARRLLVATPTVEAGADVAVAIELAELLRKHLSDGAGARNRVVSREILNRVLTASGYEEDAPLSETAVRALGTQLQVAYVVCATIRLEADGRLNVFASLASPADPAANRRTLIQDAGQPLDAFAAVLAQRLIQEIQ